MGFWFSKIPSLDQFPVTGYAISFGLDRLTPGVDNNRYDVYLSDTFCKIADQFILHVIEDNAMPGKGSGAVEKDQFKNSYREVMLSAINRAKAEQEIQVDYIARTAVAKMLIRGIAVCYDKFIANIRLLIREKENSGRSHMEDPVVLKAELSEILLNKEQIIRATGKIVFEHINDVDQRELNGIRKSNFGMDSILPEDLFLNPFLHIEKNNDYFMINTYDILPGQRIDDADKYDLLLSSIKKYLLSMGRSGFSQSRAVLDSSQPVTSPKDSKDHGTGDIVSDKQVDAWIKQTGNVDILFDFVSTRELYSTRRKQGKERKELEALKQMAQRQHRMLKFFYKKFKSSGVVERICASYEIRSVYPEYCPPLVPQVLLQFMMVPGTRKVIINRLKRLAKINQVPFSARSLKRCQKRIKGLRTSQKEAYLIRFFKGFFRYHRDFENFKLLERAMALVYLVKEENHIRLSRVNNTLYEFLLSHESTTEEKPVISHTILKVDIRGSTDIVHKMKEQGLNPASYFSLNMFDPITEIIPEYGAFKVFVEGDAMILGIYEREGCPEGWYSISRACGLAIHILLIIQRYNRKNRKYDFPFLEVGIGITFRKGQPTLFFDGDFQIMISSAINMADRLSGCSKAARKIMDSMDTPFNNYVFQTASNEDVAATSDDISRRYNVNGIELHPAAFKKLSQEIRLKPVECVIPKIQSEKIRFFTGIFPTVTGRNQRVIIREGSIPNVREHDLGLIAMTDRKYYEVCTNITIHDYFKTHEL
ncbi:hypothetical protein [Desulfobacula sp.]|uniref:hypothetical protein n=1 Tax=Desulfobacula sp. TaxID=2593537 RepID=UPI00261D1933|nr:hypothetical protein [Desulfobacula sp.]